MAEYTADDLFTMIAETYTKKINLPKFTKSPYTISLISLKNQQYYFQFFWNNRQERCYLSIFKITDGVREYYLKNKMLRNGIELSKYIFKTDWDGLLVVDSITNNFDDDYTMADIHEKFVLTYYGSD